MHNSIRDEKKQKSLSIQQQQKKTPLYIFMERQKNLHTNEEKLKKNLKLILYKNGFMVN